MKLKGITISLQAAEQGSAAASQSLFTIRTEVAQC